LPKNETHFGRLIPKIVHVTSRSRCVTPIIAHNILWWKLRGHSFYFHDDKAIMRLLNMIQWEEYFPGLHSVVWCARGASLADIWRYLVVWIYGGIYTDIDNSPNKFNEESINATDDSYFPLEGLGVMAQYFFASSPGHPLMVHALKEAIRMLSLTGNVMRNQSPFTTGPRALKNGFIFFMAEANVTTTGYIPAGLYVGESNRTVRVVGNKDDPQEYVSRGGIRQHIKVQEYAKMNMTHFFSHKTPVRNKEQKVVSCRMYMDDVIQALGTNISNPPPPEDFYSTT